MQTMTAARASAAAVERPSTSRYRRRITAGMADQFFGLGQLAALCGAMLVLGAMLFPKALIDRQLHTTAPPNAATIAYLQLLLRARPDESTTRVQLVDQRLRAGQFRRAESDLAPLINRRGPPAEQVGMMWLTLRRAQFLAIPAGAPQRPQARARYARALSRFGSQLPPRPQLGEIQQAIDAGLYEVAAQMASHLLTSTAPSPAAGTPLPGATTDRPRASQKRPAEPLHRDIEPGLLQMIGLVWSSRFDRPTHAVELPMADLTSLREQAFEAMLQSHLAAGRPADALTSAQVVLPTLDQTRVDWPALIRIGIEANRPDAAAGFAERWLAGARDERTRWAAFHALTGAYLATGNPAQALAAATLHLQQMPQTTELWRLMTQLAMQAGNGEQAARYARRLVGLEVVDEH